MSKENAKAFVQAILEDEELREKTANMKPEDALPLGKEMGYDFTLEEFTDVMNEDRELSPDKLEAVAGGAVIGGPCTSSDADDIKDTYCYGDKNGRRHDYEIVLQVKRYVLFFIPKIHNIYRCKLCGHQMEK